MNLALIALSQFLRFFKTSKNDQDFSEFQILNIIFEIMLYALTLICNIHSKSIKDRHKTVEQFEAIQIIVTDNMNTFTNWLTNVCKQCSWIVHW